MVQVNPVPAQGEYYDALVAGQQRMRASGETPSTPMVLMVPDGEGNTVHTVRVAIRQQG